MRKIVYALMLFALVGPLSPLTGQTRPNNALKRLMIDKVKGAQAMLEGVALSDFKRIQRSAEELIRISNTTEWVVHRTPRYEMYSNEFRRAAEVVIRKAKAKDIDAVLTAYADLTRSCVRCHQYGREVRDARLPGGRPDTVALSGARE
jgi:hypothetical protein